MQVPIRLNGGDVVDLGEVSLVVLVQEAEGLMVAFGAGHPEAEVVSLMAVEVLVEVRIIGIPQIVSIMEISLQLVLILLR